MGTERETVTAMIRTLVVFPHMRVMPSALHPGFRPSDMQSWCEALPIGAIRGVATSRALTAPLFKTRRLPVFSTLCSAYNVLGYTPPRNSRIHARFGP